MEASVEKRQAVTAESSARAKARLATAAHWEPVIRACAALTPTLTETLQQFWGVPVRVVLLGAGYHTHYFWRMDDFHVSQLSLAGAEQQGLQAPEAMALLKISDTACATFLNRVLGTKPAQFSFKRLSPLEATILNELGRDLMGCFMKSLLKNPAKSGKNRQVHLIWALQLEESAAGAINLPDNAQPFPEEVGKIVLSLPSNALQARKLPHSGPAAQTVPDEFFFHVDGVARIYLGNTRVALSDLDNLEPEDLIVLEDSHVSRMFVVEPLSGARIPFQAQIRQHQSITIPYTQELATMDIQPQSASARQTLWDNLMIEVGAEFEPVKLPLKHLKEMTEGLVVEMGDLVHNRVCLRVEGKVLAWGELIIVGDKFGVRVCQVEASEQGGASAEMPPMPQEMPAPVPVEPPPQPMPQEMPPPVAEEANLDNFLNEDFDETFDEDEEEW